MDLQKEVAPLVAKKAFKSPLKAGPLTDCVQTKAKKAAAPMKAMK